MAYSIYPAVDNVTLEFPPEIITALSKTEELRSTIIPMTQTQRNDLSGLNLWDGRLVFNLTTKKINRYELGTTAWYEIDSDNTVLKAGSTMTGPLVLSGAPTLDLHAATKNYVDLNRRSRNRLMNSRFIVNQRGFTSTTVNAFGHDRWALGFSGGSATYSNQSETVGVLPEGDTTYARIVTASQTSGTYVYFTQDVEDVRTLSGKTATVSFWAKAASGTPKVWTEVVQYFGTGGSTTYTVPGADISIGTSWARYSITLNIPSLIGKTLGANNRLQFRLFVSDGSVGTTRTVGIQNNTFDFWGIQLEEGLLATPLEYVSYVEDLAMCQRYWERVHVRGFHAMTGTLNNIHRQIIFKVTKRIAPPAVSVSSYTNIDNCYTNSGSIVDITTYSAVHTVPVSTPGYPYGCYEATLDFSSEF